MTKAKRNRSPTSLPARRKKIRADSHGIDGADLLGIDNAADDGSVNELLEWAAGSNDNHDLVNQTTNYLNPNNTPDSPPKQPFSANVTLNGIYIGKHTEEKVVLSVTTIKDENDYELFVSKPGKRILRISDRDTNRDDCRVTLPREPCSNVEITFTPQGCRVIVDGIVTSQEIRDPRVPDGYLADAIAKATPRDKLLGAGENEWLAMYNEWCEWTSDKMRDLRTLMTFPRMPEKARRCKDPACSRKLPDGTHREFRHIDHCRHDIEMWFQDAAGGYNETFYQMVRQEEMKWNPAKFAVLGTTLTPVQKKFRNMSGEMWKYALAMVDEYKEYMGYD